MNSAMKLKMLREEKKLTQFELAEELGVSVGSIGNVENNSRKISKLLAIKLAKKFNTEIQYWLDNERYSTSFDNQYISSIKFNTNMSQDFESLSNVVSMLINEQKIRLDNLDNLDNEIKNTLFHMLKIDISNKLYKCRLHQLEEFIKCSNLKHSSNKNNKK